MISGVLFLVAVFHQTINGVSGSPVLVTRSIANRQVWEAILYGYVVDADSPSYLERGDEIFDVPASLKDDVISIMSKEIMNMEVDYSDSEHTAAESLAVGMKVDVSYGAFSAAASMAVSSSSDKSIKTVRLDAVTKATKYEVKAIDEFLHHPEKFFTDAFKDVVKNRPFEYIEKNVGVFYAKRLDLGGELRKTYVMQATSQDNEMSVRAELEASYGKGLLGASVSASTEYGKRTSSKEANVKIEWLAKGGNTAIWFGARLDTDQDGIDDIKRRWSSTINDDNLYQFNLRLGYVWDLIKEVDLARGIAYKAFLEAKWDSQYKAFKPSKFLVVERCGYIQHYGGKCIHPLDGSANPTPGTRIVIHPGCRSERLYFCATSEGETEFKHKTSGLCIQPNSGSYSPADDERLVLKWCGHAAAKFRFTAGGSIQHVGSGRCWHPLDGLEYPHDDTEVVLHRGCNENRLKFILNYTD